MATRTRTPAGGVSDDYLSHELETALTEILRQLSVIHPTGRTDTARLTRVIEHVERICIVVTAWEKTRAARRPHP